ncbi:MAG TPA: hypothetical protein VJP80_08060 [Candidatus Saccharimonadales bacterium]|nr:hypothetical protein [Candidatus Saccharimonadales bacterium]
MSEFSERPTTGDYYNDGKIHIIPTRFLDAAEHAQVTARLREVSGYPYIGLAHGVHELPRPEEDGVSLEGLEPALSLFEGLDSAYKEARAPFELVTDREPADDGMVVERFWILSPELPPDAVDGYREVAIAAANSTLAIRELPFRFD